MPFTEDRRTRAADASPLARALAGALRGEVRFDDGARALYATDASNYRHVPIGVVVPRDIEDAVRALALCREHDAAVLARGGGTSLAGQCCNEAVVIDCSKYVNRILELDPHARRARVEPGCILDHLRHAAEAHDLTFGPDPATHDHNTLGGMLGNNSCGVHSVMAGRTADNVHSLDVVTYDGLRMRVGPTPDAELERIIREGGRRGEIYAGLKGLRDHYAELIRARYPQIPRRVSGYSLDELLPEKGCNVARALVGSEGTCVFICEAELQLVPSPRGRVLLVIGFPDVFRAADCVPQVLEHGPIGLEGLDEILTGNMRKKRRHEGNLELLPDGAAWLYAEFGGDTQEEAQEKAQRLAAVLEAEQGLQSRLFCDPNQQERLWAIRESGLGATARVPGEADTWPGWEDSAVPPARFGDYLRELRRLFERYGYSGSFYGHFGDGVLHTRIDFDLRSEAGIRKYRAFVGEAADLVVRYGGSLSGEHGDGQSRSEMLEKMYGPELLQAFREFKAIWDPRWKMNPGRVVEPRPITADLRLGANYSPWEPQTRFAYPDDDGKFSRATLRCVGVGKCRRMGGGVMCPSFMATREEKHSTRGRARLLFEMLQQHPLERGWRSDAVHEALDLCLACKGCKRDCPVDVDMATYKAEFNSHYYAGRLRPREMYAMGLIWWWARAASHAPGLANFFTQTAGLRDAVKWIGGLHPARQLPAFARTTFREWFAARSRMRRPRGERVLLFPDTFNNYFDPHIAIAAVEVLEAAGCHVVIPPRVLCCGRPLYAPGMLGLAKRLLEQNLAVLEPELQAGTPIVMLEPSCCAAFRDELPNMLPGDERARRLQSSALMLGEFLQRRADYRPPRIAGEALVHVHCNHHAVLKFDEDRNLLCRTGLEHRVLDSGCCGMAGSFGFERGHYEVSVKCAERVLLPAVRQADAETMILTDGFSCREQIAQGTGRRALHLAELLRDAHRGIGTGGAHEEQAAARGH